MTTTSAPPVINEQQLYNRAAYVHGADTQAKYGQTKMLLVGLTGLGCEIAKNLVLTGIQQLTLLDPRPVLVEDLSSLFFAAEEDVGRNRDSTIISKIAELNRFVEVKLETRVTAEQVQDLSMFPESILSEFHVVLFVDAPTTSRAMIRLNHAARSFGVKFVCCESRGVAGSVFVDAGPEFNVLDKNGEELVSAIVLGITSDGVVFCHDDKKHECELGDRVFFTGIQKPEELNSSGSNNPVLFDVIDICGPCTLKVRAAEGLPPSIFKKVVPNRGYMHTTKQSIHMKCLSLEASIVAPSFNFIDDDCSKLCAPSELHEIFQACHIYLTDAKKKHQFGMPSEQPAVVDEIFGILIQTINPKFENISFAKQIITTFGANLNPMACVIGGLATQEALKVCSGKFTPLQQWFYYDVREILPTVEVLLNEWQIRAPGGSRYDGQVRAIGRELQEKITTRNAFIVGSGALGCELIKNFALMGVGSTSDSAVYVTDMDTIEVTNLSRQFLFRAQHVGQPKAKVAAAAGKIINPHMRIVCHEAQVSSATEHIFDPPFWENLDFVCNALDNVIARRYVDSQCLSYQKPLFESGTLGTKCNCQPIIPFLTESYSSSYDPPEKSIPLCTLKNFPSSIEHTIQWAREMFMDFFNSAPNDVNRYLHQPDFLESLERDPGSKPLVFAKLVHFIEQHRPRNSVDCVLWACRKFEEMFHHLILQLLHNLPLDRLDDKGQPLWTGAKKPPTAIFFDCGNKLHLEFIFHAACLFGEMYGIDVSSEIKSNAEVAAVSCTYQSVPFIARQMNFALTEADKADEGTNGGSSATAAKLAKEDLPSILNNSTLHMKPIEFEKDNETNHHVDFITACSNLRATSYDIPVADVIRTRMIAGKIIPAMVTTTSLVTGLVGFEIIKYLKGERDINLYRSSSVNIALPLLALNSPQLCLGKKYESRGQSVTWSIWDRLDVSLGKDVSLQEFMSHLETKFHLDVFMMSTPCGKLIYSSFARRKEKMAKLVSIVVGEVLKLKEGVKYLSFVATGSFGDVEADIPLIRYQYRW